MISRDNSNEFIFTGLQILNRNFNSIKEKVFSMNEIWNYLIKENSLIGTESKQKFYHLSEGEWLVLGRDRFKLDEFEQHFQDNNIFLLQNHYQIL